MDTKQKHRYNQHAKDLKPLPPRTEIWIQNDETGQWNDMEKVISKVRKRTYRIKLENGRTMYRNMLVKFLKSIMLVEEQAKVVQKDVIPRSWSEMWIMLLSCNGKNPGIYTS